MNIATPCLLIALILFTIEAVRSKNIVAAGLAFATASQLVGVLG